MQSIVRDVHSINFLLVIGIVVVAALAVAVTRRIIPAIALRAPLRLRHALLRLTSVLRVSIYLTALWAIVPLVISPTRERVMALLGGAALAIGFAFKDYVSSLIAGAVGMFERTYRLGDRVRIGETYGEVRSLNLRSVKIVTPDDTAVYLPHSQIWHEPVYNANDGARTMLCVAHFHLNAEHDGAHVLSKLGDVAITSPYIDLDYPISVIAAEEPWGTHYKLKAYVVDNRDEFYFVTDLTLRSKSALARLGVKPAHMPPIRMIDGS